MKQQTIPPTCVTMGANRTWCVIGKDDYNLSDNSRIDAGLVNFLDAAKAANTLGSVVSRVSITITRSSI